MSTGAGQPPPRGKQFGRYLLLDCIGRGGMAEVFHAVMQGPSGFQRRFVIKRIRKEKADSREFVDMFINEARISALLDHPNIVQVYDFGEEQGDYFLAMEYLRGKDLRALMSTVRSQGMQLGLDIACHVAKNVAQGLNYAHRLQSGGRPLGIVHRDVTPSNIMTLRTGGIKLLDFGIARAAMRSRSLTPAGGMIKGKLSYLAPEQIKGGATDPRTDVWALGVVFWEILTGQRLFWDENDLNVMRNVMKKPIEAPSRFRAGIPTEIDAIVLQALKRSATERFQTAEAFHEALRDLPLDYGDAERRLSALLEAQIGTGSFEAGPIPDLTALDALAARKTGSRRSVETPRPSADDSADLESYSTVSSVHALPQAPRQGRLGVALAALAALAVSGGLLLGPSQQTPAQSTPIKRDGLQTAPLDPAVIEETPADIERPHGTTNPPSGTSASEAPEAKPEPLEGDQAREPSTARTPTTQASLSIDRPEGLTAESSPASASAELQRALQDPSTDGLGDRPGDQKTALKANRNQRPTSPTSASRNSPVKPSGTTPKPHAAPHNVKQGLPEPTRAPKKSAKAATKTATTAPSDSDTQDASSAVRGRAQIDPNNQDTKEAKARGLAAAQEGRVEQAHFELTRVVQAGGANAKVFSALAQVEFDLGLTESARRHAESAVKHAPRNHNHRVLLGDLCYRLGDYACARAAYGRAAKMAPGNKAVSKRLHRLEQTQR